MSSSASMSSMSSMSSMGSMGLPMAYSHHANPYMFSAQNFPDPSAAFQSQTQGEQQFTQRLNYSLKCTIKPYKCSRYMLQVTGAIQLYIRQFDATFNMKLYTKNSANNSLDIYLCIATPFHIPHYQPSLANTHYHPPLIPPTKHNPFTSPLTITYIPYQLC